MKRIFILILIFVASYNVQAQLQVTYYIAGDADDWQLFMSHKLIGELDAGGKTVIITFTAGDEGNGLSTFNGAPTPYYLAKERGSVYSSKFVADFMNMPYPLTYSVPTAQNVNINGKTIVKYFYGNANGVGSVVNYFLRLPDGGPTGAGFPATGNKSLKKLKDGVIPNITSIDLANTYTWTELVNTVYAIIFAEKGSDPQVWINAANLNSVTNPNDYSDHTYSSTAAQEAVATRLWIGINEYIMDYSANLADNTNNEPYEQAAGTFNAYNWSLIQDKYNSQFNSTIRAWLHKEYVTIKRSPTGNGPLPITLMNFSGTLKGNNVLLEWTTSSEINSKEFEIEKSNDGIFYRKLGTVAAAGYSTTEKKYSYLDIEATELNYYRLKMVDVDGANKLSNVVIIKNNVLSQSVFVLNNPFTDQIRIRFAKSLKGTVALSLIDLSGKLISKTEINNPASSVIRFDYNKPLSRGIYMLRIENEGKQYNVKLVKE